MRVLITGVAGHLGSALAGWILEHQPGVSVVGIDDLSCGYRENVPAGVKFHELDLTSCKCPMCAVQWALHGPDRFDVVYHFAAYAAECFSPFCRRFNVRSNWEATAAVINACLEHGCGRLVFASSMAIYGRGAAPFSELDPCAPIDPYGVAKLACERDIQIAGQQHGLAWTIVRPHNIYGPGQSLWQKYRNVLGLWMRAVLEDQPLRIFGDGLQRRAFSYVGDILRPLWLAGTSPAAAGLVINLGGSREVSILHAAELVREVTGARSIEHAPPRHEVREAWATTERSARVLEYRDQTSLLAGITAMWGWAQEAWPKFPERRHARLPQAEIYAGLPDVWR